MTSSGKKYRNKRKDKILLILLSNTLMKKKFKKFIFSWATGVNIIFFLTFLGIFLPFINGGLF